VPWRDHRQLGELAASIKGRLLSHTVDGLAGGPGWLRLTFVDPEGGLSRHLYLVAKPGTVMLWPDARTLPRHFDQALGRVRQQDLTVTPWLHNAVLQNVFVPTDDRIMFLEFKAAGEGQRIYLAQQFFGPQGNLALMDGKSKRLWSAHRSPHPALLERPPLEFAVEPTIDETSDRTAAETAVAKLETFLIRDISERMSAVLTRAETATGKLIANLQADLDNAEKGDHFRHLGETLAIHLHALQRGESSVRLTNAQDEEIDIPLDAAITPAANMELYFKKARRAERGRDVIGERLQEARQKALELAQVTQAYADIDLQAPEALENLLDWRSTHQSALERYYKPETIARRRPETASRPFRRFRVDGKWEIWVGRDNKENDALTHKASAPTDWWFHAQGVAGSHVILRANGKPEQVPRSVLEKAAALAAQYSKSRNSSLAPVIHTLRKYVRKPRKTPPGTAVCEREKSLMVEPGLAPGVVAEP
jgi:predicted ribosome quality control (RQC) complex YloA/Tae2 family protein